MLLNTATVLKYVHWHRSTVVIASNTGFCPSYTNFSVRFTID